MTEPMRVGELLPGVLQEVIDRAGPGYQRWAEQVWESGYSNGLSDRGALQVVGQLTRVAA